MHPLGQHATVARSNGDALVAENLTADLRPPTSLVPLWGDQGHDVEPPVLTLYWAPITKPYRHFLDPEESGSSNASLPIQGQSIVSRTPPPAALGQDMLTRISGYDLAWSGGPTKARIAAPPSIMTRSLGLTKRSGVRINLWCSAAVSSRSPSLVPLAVPPTFRLTAADAGLSAYAPLEMACASSSSKNKRIE